jgi:hypothetical protein
VKQASPAKKAAPRKPKAKKFTPVKQAGDVQRRQR